MEPSVQCKHCKFMSESYLHDICWKLGLQWTFHVNDNNDCALYSMCHVDPIDARQFVDSQMAYIDHTMSVWDGYKVSSI